MIKNIEIHATEEQQILGDLIQWAIGNRGRKDCNPYSVLEIKAALQYLAKLRGIDSTDFSKYCDAADFARK